MKPRRAKSSTWSVRRRASYGSRPAPLILCRNIANYIPLLWPLPLCTVRIVISGLLDSGLTWSSQGPWSKERRRQCPREGIPCPEAPASSRGPEGVVWHPLAVDSRCRRRPMTGTDRDWVLIVPTARSWAVSYLLPRGSAATGQAASPCTRCDVDHSLVRFAARHLLASYVYGCRAAGVCLLLPLQGRRSPSAERHPGRQLGVKARSVSPITTPLPTTGVCALNLRVSAFSFSCESRQGFCTKRNREVAKSWQTGACEPTAKPARIRGSLRWLPGAQTARTHHLNAAAYT